MNVEFLLKVKKYIEESEVIFDGEWGSGYDLEELLKNVEMPDIYNEVLELLKQ